MTTMIFGMALVSRILMGEEPCLRKVQFSKLHPLPTDPRLIQYKMNHELLASKVIHELTGEIRVNQWVSKTVNGITLNGIIDIVSITPDLTTIIEVKSGKEKESHHVQLWLYMMSYEAKRIKGEIRYCNTKYTYLPHELPPNLWDYVYYRVRPLLTSELLPPVKGSHCSYCGYRNYCQQEVITR